MSTSTRIAGRRFEGACFPPYADESLLGFLTRALRHTAIRQLERGLNAAGASRPEPVAIATTLSDPAQIAALAHAFGCEHDAIRSRTYINGTFDHSTSETLTFFGTKIRAQYREAKIRRVSPRALEIAPYHRAIWELRPFAFDPSTRELLLDTCPVCAKKLGWRRVQGATMCDRCVDGDGLPNVDLRDFPQAVFEVDDEEALHFVTGLVDPLDERKAAARHLLPPSWHHVSNAAVFEAVMALVSGLTMDPDAANGVQGRAKSNDQFRRLSPEMFAIAGRAIIGGEKGFAVLADRFRADMDKRPQHYGRRKELGGLAYLAYDRHIDPDAKMLLKSSIDTNMKFTSRAHELRTGQDADDAYLSIDAFAHKFGVRRSILSRLAKSGLVTVIKAKEAKLSPVRMRIAEVKPLLEQLKDAIGENEAAGLLGLPLHVLPSLADRGLIRRLEGAVNGLVPGHAGYSNSSIAQLMENIWSAARPASAKCRSVVVAARSIGAGETPWGAVIFAIVAGDAAVVDTGAQRRNIRFSLAVEDTAAFVTGVNKHLRTPAVGAGPPQWIAPSTAAEILHVNEAFLSRLANARPDLLPKRGPGYTLYLASDVQALAATHMFVPEIARRADMHPRRGVSWLRSEGVHPSLSLQENRDFGYPRSIVDPLLTELIDKTARKMASLGEAGDGIRVRLVAAVAAGAGIKAIAEAMGVPYRKAERWIRVWREASTVAPRRFGKVSKLDAHEDFLRKLVDEQPNIKLDGIREALAEQGVKTSLSAIWNAIERFGIRLADRRARHTENVQRDRGPSRPGKRSRATTRSDSTLDCPDHQNQ